MSLNNTKKDIIGSLRNLFLVLCLAKLDDLELPADTNIDSCLAEYRAQYSQAAIHIAHGSLIDEEGGRELESAIGDITTKEGNDYYDERTLNLYLSLFGRLPSIQRFDYRDADHFRKQLRPVIKALVTNLTQLVLWNLIDVVEDTSRFEMRDQRVVAPVTSLVAAMLELDTLTNSCRGHVPSLLHFLRQALSEWLDSTQSRIDSDGGEGEQTALRMVVSAVGDGLLKLDETLLETN